MDKHPAPQMGSEGTVVGKRLLAFIVDSIILGVLSFAILLPSFFLGDIIGLLAMMVVGVGSLVYVFLLEGIYGYTPGKHVMGLVVVKSDGSQCTMGASIIRNLLLIVDNLPFAYIIGLALILITDRKQRVGDLVADTVVVSQR